jgi:hypothetical protein
VALKPNQITGTVFTELNDEKVLQVSRPAGSVGTRGGAGGYHDVDIQIGLVNPV